MNLKNSLIHLFKEDTPVDDEEERAGAEQTSQAKPSQNSRTLTDSEKGPGDTGIISSGGTTYENGVDLEHDEEDEEEQYDSTPVSSTADADTQPSARTRGLRTITSRLWYSLCPPPSNEQEIQAYLPHYRILPIVSGIAIPFCILLEIPGLTEPWYIRTQGPSVLTEKHNPRLLYVGIALSISCAVLANTCLVIRFLERRIKTMTILCVIFLSIHDIINITALSTYGASKDGYTFGQAFWMTLCSTIVSAFTNVTLIIDLIRTPDFKRSGSGLTRRQRSLVIIIIGLFCYIALGALINSFLLHLTFINALYFTVVTIETIGFGDIVPTTRSSRVFVCFYSTLGLINLAFVVGYVRETLLEGLDFGYRRRVLEIQEKRRAANLRRRAERRWRRAIIWRLRERHEPVWIPNASDSRSLWSKLRSCFWHTERAIWSTAKRSRDQSYGRHGRTLNLWALPRCQLEAAALEAGAPLDTLLPADFYDTYTQDACQHARDTEHYTLPSWFAAHPVYHNGVRTNESLTHRRLGAMAAMITKLSFIVYESGGNALPKGRSDQATSESEGPQDSFGSLQTSLSDAQGDYRADVEDTEKKAYYKRFGWNWVWFLIFWMGGAFIFKLTEGWTYGMSIYFCFIAFSTIGYGDLAPTTPASRCIFVLWALVGVATMTIFISVASEAYTSRYKNILGRKSFKGVVQQYHKRTKVQLSKNAERISASNGVKFTLHDTIQEETEIINESPSGGTDDDNTTGAVASTSKTDSHVQYTQRSLEQLPRKILTEIRTIQQYMQLIGDLDTHSSDTEKFVGETLWSLVDDVMGTKKLSNSAKMDILRDGESRQTLMMLGIERSLKELGDISEQEIAAIRERDKIIESLERGRGHGEVEGEQTIITSSS